MLRGDWRTAYDAAGWPVLLAVLTVAPLADGGAALHAEVARAAAALMADALTRNALLADLDGLRFLAATLMPLVTAPAAAAAAATAPPAEPYAAPILLPTPHPGGRCCPDCAPAGA
eukprot:5717379-Prymnesium_polylepis.1